MEVSFCMVRRAAWITLLTALTGAVVFGQMGTFMGKVVGEDGKGVQNVVIKIERKDIKGNWQTKTNKKGDWIYSGMPVPGQFAITCEVNGRVADQLNGVRSQMGDPVELKDFCDLKKLIARQKAQEAAMQTGQVTQEMARDMSPEQKAAMEKAMKERSAQMAKNKALNDAYNAGMAAMQVKDYPTAIESFKKAGELDPKQAAVWICSRRHTTSLRTPRRARRRTRLCSLLRITM